MSKDNLGDRMKGNYENRYRMFLTRRTPVIIRIDGKAFHTFTRNMCKPRDMLLLHVMWKTAKYLCENIMGCKMAYTQSDEISLLLIDYDRLTSQAWFDYNLQKICSVSASMATMAFNKFFHEEAQKTSYIIKFFHKETQEISYKNEIPAAYSDHAMFDARAFNIPESEVCNYFIWRQQDAIRNSVEMLGQSYYPQSKLQNKSCEDIKKMLLEEHQIDWNNFATIFRMGVCIIRKEFMPKDHLKIALKLHPEETDNWMIHRKIPIFTEDRNYIERYLIPADTE